MIHNKIEVKSGKYRLRKMTKTQVRNRIRDEGGFHGYFCGNKVTPSQIAVGWHLGIRVDINDIEQFEKAVSDFETGLNVYHPEFGQYPHYYQIIDEA